jgi:hypothetical protein
MTHHVHETAPTHFVQVGDAKVTYRRFGQRGALPLLLLNYWAANMDDWDPKITNGFAAERDVIILDYPESLDCRSYDERLRRNLPCPRPKKP